ncbi:MAG: DUF3172 domain-containing protein, partial [Cyanobacteriota bacterium]|nr:DUF3172 domain-containing protein [Cyanobacteriota bacterium]
MNRSRYNRQSPPESYSQEGGRGDRYSRRNRYESEDYSYDRSPSSRSGPPTPPGGNGIRLNTASLAVLAGVLIVGIGIGSAVTSTTQGDQGNIA